MTVLVDSPEGERITVAQLAKIVAGEHAPLWEPIETGFWLRARIDTVRSLDQQSGPSRHAAAARGRTTSSISP